MPYFDAAGEPKELWEVPGASHTGGLDAQAASTSGVSSASSSGCCSAVPTPSAGTTTPVCRTFSTSCGRISPPFPRR